MASVTYNFTAYDTYDEGNGQGSVSGSASYTSPTFITFDTGKLGPSSLNSYNAFSSTEGPIPFEAIAFYPSPTFGGFRYDAFQFDVPNPTVNYDVDYDFYFAPGDFSAPGTHNTVIFGTFQEGQLVVSGSPSAAPEPSTWGLMIAGIGGISVALRRTKKARFALKG